MSEKFNNFVENTGNRFCTVSSLMIIVIILQVIILCKLSYINEAKQIERPNIARFNNNIEKIRRNSLLKHKKFFKDFDKEIEEMRKNRERILFEIDSMLDNDDMLFDQGIKYNNNPQQQKTTKKQYSREFVFRPKIKETEKDFTFKMNLPKDIKKNDIKTSFKDNMLNVQIEKREQGKGYFYFNSFNEMYTLQSKATENEIKTELNDGILTIIVPKK